MEPDHGSVWSYHRSAWKDNSRKSVCSIVHSSVPTGPKTPDSPALGSKICPYMSWRRIKMRSPA